MPTFEEWLASTGPRCSKCGKEYFKGHDGMCEKCWEKTHEIEYRIPENMSGFVSMTTIASIVHPVRKNN